LDWQSFHDVFVVTFGFPAFYGRNMNAWNDCMSYLDDPDAGMTSVHAPPGGVVVLNVAHAREFAKRLPDIYNAMIECAAFVNWRRLERGGAPVLAVSFYE
jgi:hypothetical protein